MCLEEDLSKIFRVFEFCLVLSESEIDMAHFLRRTVLTLCAAASLVMVTGVAQARSIADIKKSGTIVVATEGAFAPFNFYEGKKLTGFEVELAEAVVAKMGLKIDWKTIGFDALLTGLQQDKWDVVIASHGINPEREKAVTFLTPHYCTGGVIVSKGAAIRTEADLVGKTVSVQTGTSYLSEVQKIKGIKEVKNFPKDPEAMAALASGRVDAWVSDKFVAKEALAAKGMEKSDLKIGGFLFVEKIAAAVAKGNTGLANEVNAAIKAVVADGTYTKISQKYFKEDIRCK